jgi:hypothetical protein
MRISRPGALEGQATLVRRLSCSSRWERGHILRGGDGQNDQRRAVASCTVSATRTGAEFNNSGIQAETALPEGHCPFAALLRIAKEHQATWLWPAVSQSLALKGLSSARRQKN